MLQILDRVPPFAAGDVEDEKEQPAARDVPEKIVAEPDVSMRAFDQSRNIRDRRAPIAVEFHHADHRMQRREWIRRDLRVRRGNLSEQSRFPGIRITDQSRVGDRAQLEHEMSLSRLPRLRCIGAARDSASS